jgi:hypothetical protein
MICPPGHSQDPQSALLKAKASEFSIGSALQDALSGKL